MSHHHNDRLPTPLQVVWGITLGVISGVAIYNLLHCCRRGPPAHRICPDPDAHEYRPVPQPIPGCPDPDLHTRPPVKPCPDPKKHTEPPVEPCPDPKAHERPPPVPKTNRGYTFDDFQGTSELAYVDADDELCIVKGFGGKGEKVKVNGKPVACNATNPQIATVNYQSGTKLTVALDWRRTFYNDPTDKLFMLEELYSTPADTPIGPNTSKFEWLKSEPFTDAHGKQIVIAAGSEIAADFVYATREVRVVYQPVGSSRAKDVTSFHQLPKGDRKLERPFKTDKKVFDV